MNNYMYDKKDVESMFLKIKDIFKKDEKATIIASDFLKAIYYGLVENIEEIHDIAYLKYAFKNENIFVTIAFDVTSNIDYFISEFHFRDSNEEFDIYYIKYDSEKQYYIWQEKSFSSHFIFLVSDESKKKNRINFGSSFLFCALEESNPRPFGS